MSLLDKASIVWPKGAPSKAGFVANWNPQTGALVDFPITRATTKTYVDSDGLIKTAAANVLPRDFTNGGCGDWMIEPQRTNQNDDYDISSIAAIGTVTSESTVTDSDFFSGNAKRLESSSNAFCVTSRNNVIAGTENTVSCFYKLRSGNYLIRFSGNIANSAGNLTIDSSGVEISNTSSIVINLIRVVNYPNGTTRLELSWIPDKTYLGTTGIYFGVANDGGTNGDADFNDTQSENGSYATSLIPTSGTAVTRNADVPALTGASALLNDSAGGMFIEVSPFNVSSANYISLVNSITVSENVAVGFFSNSFRAVVNNTISMQGGSPVVNNFYKLSVRYVSGNIAFYADGAIVGSSTSSFDFSGSLNQVQFNSRSGGPNPFYGRIRQLVIFNEAPTNAELAALTS